MVIGKERPNKTIIIINVCLLIANCILIMRRFADQSFFNFIFGYSYIHEQFINLVFMYSERTVYMVWNNRIIYGFIFIIRNGFLCNKLG